MNLNQVTVPSTDVQRAIAFYQQLGLILIVKDLPKYARFMCPDGSATFSVELVETRGQGAAPMVYFECSDLDATVHALAQKGMIFDTPPTDQPWLWRDATLRDPDGNRLCLYYAGDNRLNPPWRLQEEA